MAQLNWLHNYDTDTTSLDIDNIRYETVDGGQNIYKYVDGELEKRIRQFPEEADDYLWEGDEKERFKECPHDELILLLPNTKLRKTKFLRCSIVLPTK